MPSDGSQAGHLGEAAWRAVSRSQVVLELGLDRRILWANAAAAALFGYPREELAGMHHAELCRPFAGARVDNEEFWAKLLSGRFDRSEYKRYGRGGREIWLQATYNPVLDEAGAVRSILKLATDVTERRRLEAETAGRLAAIDRSQFVLELAPDGTILDLNGKLACALGYPRAAMIGRPHRSFIARREGAADADPADPHRTIAYRTADGGELLVQATTSPILDASGQPAKALVLGVDVTERSELRSALERAEAAAQAKSAFLANMSHEVRTPMAGVMGFAELLLKGELAPDQRRQAQMILDSGQTMLALLNDILDVSKIEAGKMEIAAEPVDVGHKVRACVELMRPVAERKGLALRCEIAPELPQWIACDALRLRQIVLNLVGNAVKFTERGSVSITAERAWDDPQAVAISVADTGIGMTGEQLALAMAKFEQADPSVQRRFGGSGLGLTISSEIARLMGGDLSLASEHGRGTRAELRLPLAVCDAGAATAAGPVTIARERRRDRPRVLVAEDHDINQALVLDQLDRVGARGDIAPNGAIAVAMVAEAVAAGDPYRLVLMDLQMPVMDGLEAARRLRASGHSPCVLPIVSLTANAFAEEREACLAAGMQGHLAKPVELAALAQAIDRWAPEHPPARETLPVAAARPSAERLAALYDERRRTLFDRLDALGGGAAAAEIDALADQMHKVAGVAEHFGDGAVGRLAKSWEHRLRSAAPGERIGLVEQARREFARAA